MIDRKIEFKRGVGSERIARQSKCERVVCSGGVARGWDGSSGGKWVIPEVCGMFHIINILRNYELLFLG
jgi:hypothetical protein